MKKFNKLFNTIMEETKSLKIKTKKIIKESDDWDEEYEDNEQEDDDWSDEDEDLYNLTNDETFYNDFKEKVYEIFRNMDLDEDIEEDLWEYDEIEQLTSPDVFDEMTEDEDVYAALKKVAEDNSDENLEELDQAVQRWIRDYLIANYLDNKKQNE